MRATKLLPVDDGKPDELVHGESSFGAALPVKLFHMKGLFSMLPLEGCLEAL